MTMFLISYVMYLSNNKCDCYDHVIYISQYPVSDLASDRYYYPRIIIIINPKISLKCQAITNKSCLIHD